VSCNKLFKGADFLGKHMRLKHEDFAAQQLLQDAMPFMRRRYEAEPMGARPLPPVEVEAHGRTELKSVKTILDKYMPQAPAAPAAPRDQAQQPYARRGGEGRRGHDDRDRRNAGPQSHGGDRQGPAPIRQQVQYVQPQPEQNFSRKISSYVDVDAPKVRRCSRRYCNTVFSGRFHNLSQSAAPHRPFLGSGQGAFTNAQHLLQMWYIACLSRICSVLAHLHSQTLGVAHALREARRGPGCLAPCGGLPALRAYARTSPAECFSLKLCSTASY
jgi:hypothetical protein